MAEPRPLWVVSNGHAEDALAARLLGELLARGAVGDVVALPLVGEGRPYDPLARAGVTIAGPRRRLPADGLTLHHPALLLADLRAGLLGVTWAQLRTLASARPASAVVVVGDVYAQALATLLRAPRRFVVQPLVSVRMADGASVVPPHRWFMERIRAPELALLRRAEAAYARDEDTAAWLRARGVRAQYLGQAAMDGLDGRRLDGWPDLPTLALLPGTRAYAPAAVARMAAALAALADGGTALAAAVAWTRAEAPPPPPGWSWAAAPLGGWPTWGRAGVRVAWVRDRFADVLTTADAVLGATGTAQEQAVGLGLPVVTFPVPPALGRAFLRNQARLLGPALEVVEDPGPGPLAAAVRRALDDPTRRAVARADGPARMGPPGGTAAIAADLAARFGGAFAAGGSAGAGDGGGFVE